MAKGPTVVFKIGGEILGTPTLLNAAAGEIIKLKKQNPATKVILVHGAGPQIDTKLKSAGIEIKRIAGRRVTSKEALDHIWTDILEESKVLAKKLEAAGIKAHSIDLSLTTLAKRSDKKLGFVGHPIGVNTHNLNRELRRGVVPIVSIFGVTKNREVVNVNADEVASAIARAMKAQILDFKTNTAGILRMGKTVGRITPTMAKELITKGVVKDGMLVKTGEAVKAVKGGVSKVRISQPGQKKGTTIRPGRRRRKNTRRRP